ncbi:MAG TPA: potassium-transporting ATPase subunit KdpB, partial [Gammaproteobacteria bacterium]|nr:potassium-transporting ATPase subunit KdpB [Gammaproteobacteria bacterium]
MNFLTRPIVSAAIRESFAKLHPRVQFRNPVMFVVFLGSIYTTLIGVAALFGLVSGEGHPVFVLAISAWLWLTVLFANFAEAVAEGRGKAQAATLRSMRQHVHAKKILDRARKTTQTVEASALKRGDLVLVQANDTIPADGEVVEGVASVNESAVTGESAPVLREAGGDFSSVTGGTKVLSDWLIVQITSREGEGFLDRMIALVEGAKRGRTPNEIALSILLAMMTIVFLLATATLSPYSHYAVASAGTGSVVTATVLVALLVCLIPTTIGALLSAIGIAGMDRMVRANVIATSGRAVEAAGDVDVLLLDKTGTITLGDRHATAFHPAPRIDARELADAAQLASLADETPEGRSIVVLAKQQYQLRGRDVSTTAHTFHKFSAQTRMSGVDVEGRRLRKGAADAIKKFVEAEGGTWPATVGETVDKIARAGATPLVVAAAGNGARVLGVIELRDIVKGGIRER